VKERETRGTVRGMLDVSALADMFGECAELPLVAPSPRPTRWNVTNKVVNRKCILILINDLLCQEIARAALLMMTRSRTVSLLML